jgi:hypothetical protein
LILRVLFILFLLLFFTACDDTKKNWVNNTILSEKNILVASSINVKSILEKSEFENIENLTDEQKIIFNAINPSFISHYLGFDIDSPQKLFIVFQENKFNAAIFLVGEITNKYIFKESIKSFLSVNSFLGENPTICFSEKYNLSIGFNSSHFLVGFSLDKNFTLEKINSYFQSNPVNSNNHLLSEFLNKTDDYSFYISNSNVVEFISSIKIPFIKSQISNYINLNLLTEDFILDLNFLNGKIVANTLYSSSSYKTNSLSAVDRKYIDFLTNNDSLLSFGFANVPLNKLEKYFNQIIKSTWDLENKQSRLDLSKILPALDGSMSFSINKALNPLITTDYNMPQKDKNIFSNQNPSLNDKVEESEDNWEDDDFFQEEEVMENSNISTLYNISLGIEEKQILVDVFHKNNLELKEDELLNTNNTFLLYKNDILHLSNNLQLLESILKDETKPYSKIKESHFQNPVYMHIDLESILMVYFPKTILENIDEKQNLRQIFTNIILNSSKDGLHIEFELKQKDKNALQLFLEAIIENKTLENYL